MSNTWNLCDKNVWKIDVHKYKKIFDKSNEYLACLPLTSPSYWISMTGLAYYWEGTIYWKYSHINCDGFHLI